MSAAPAIWFVLNLLAIAVLVSFLQRARPRRQSRDEEERRANHDAWAWLAIFGFMPVSMFLILLVSK
jgi:ABC-type Fe3+ transport system permease subunit